ncbi:16S rRNA (cytosine(1402)-N(4))-methyltransferase [Paenibacillus sp. FSL H8-0548]|uniref:tRNA (mnm(5)s(2)U34)-methyltransferase n=1 Tax=Paenibacillus sp. FSL H8-0548 TaxID=1920422 RepID=UPI00096D0571|nr:class I SAM-dependent methyltransferase [Paenibacillus sp. FSL H8-0548]OMF38707.1 16S rRNA (cytosine(1402)-N(4))-methyltransferase [Paenibacillus sp. FSL H8-0548]
MGFLSMLSMAHKWVSERTSPGDIVIDATAGGGVDTLALAKLVGPSGIVYAFDIQQEALDRTQERLSSLAKEHLPKLQLLLENHSEMAKAVDPAVLGHVSAIMFNLGYLPGSSDLTIITEPVTTLAALNAALSLLRPGGIITAVLYPGHPGGAEEAASVESWAAQLPQGAAQTVIYRQTQRIAAPYLIAVEKR